MAWVLANTSAGNINYLHRLDNSKLVYAVGLKAYTWDGASEVEIGDFSAFDDLSDIAVFGGDVYAKTWTDAGGGNNNDYVYRYDGTPGSWTLVDQKLGYNPGFQTYQGVLAATFDLTSYLFCNYESESRSMPHPGWSSDTMPVGATSMDDAMFALTNGDMYNLYCDLDANRYIKLDIATFIWAQIGSLPALHATIVQYGEGFSGIYCQRSADNLVRVSQDDANSWNSTGMTCSAPVALSSRVGSVLHEFMIDNLAAPKNIYYLDPSTTTWSAILTGGTMTLGYLAVWNNRLYTVDNNKLYYENTFVPYVPPASGSVPGGNYALVFDVNQDDTYLYIAILVGGKPELLRMPADLVSAPATMFNPGAGTYINVICGEENKDWVWISGDFGVAKLELSLDDGTTWAVKDPSWANLVSTFSVGPNSDDLVEVVLDDNSVQETLDGGLNWAQRSADVGMVTYAMDRLDINTEEAVIGADISEAGVVRLQYTPNNFGSLGDITGTVPADASITDIIVG